MGEYYRGLPRRRRLRPSGGIRIWNGRIDLWTRDSGCTNCAQHGSSWPRKYASCLTRRRDFIWRIFRIVSRLFEKKELGGNDDRAYPCHMLTCTSFCPLDGFPSISGEFGLAPGLAGQRGDRAAFTFALSDASRARTTDAEHFRDLFGEFVPFLQFNDPFANQQRTGEMKRGRRDVASYLMGRTR